MNVLGISGTPRKNGNSTILLDYALRPFADAAWVVNVVRLSETTVLPCRGCDHCVKRGECIQDDDMKRIYRYFEQCDALVVSSPIYYRNITSTLQAVLERYYAVKDKRLLAFKPGGAITVGRGTCGGQAIGLDIIYNWMRSCGMVCVSGELNGVTAVADKPGDVLAQETRLEQAEVLGRNILHVARKLRAEKP